MAYERNISLPNVEYKSPSDFNVSFTGTTSGDTTGSIILLTGVPITIQNSGQIAYILAISGTTSRIYIIGLYGVTFSYDNSTDIITIYGAGTPFQSGDEYVVGLNGPKPGLDLGLDLNKSQEQSPASTWYTDGEQVTVTSGFTSGWTDLCSEIDMREFTQLNLYLTLDINDSQNARIKALGKYEFGGVDEFDLVQKTETDSVTYIKPSYIEFSNDNDQLVTLSFNTNGVPYIQLQIMAEIPGSTVGGITDCYINKIWK